MPTITFCSSRARFPGRTAVTWWCEGREAKQARKAGRKQLNGRKIMPKVDVVDLENKVVGNVELADEVFAAEVNEALLYEAVRHFQAECRAGTHKTKVRGSVSGSGKKLWK